MLVYTEINEVQGNEGNHLQLPVGKIVEMSIEVRKI
jgi:hypothetical protein